MYNLDALINAIAEQDDDPAYALGLTGYATKRLRRKVDSLRKRIAQLGNTHAMIRLCQRLKLPPSFLSLDKAAFASLSAPKQAIVLNSIDSINSLYLEHLSSELSRSEASLAANLPPGWAPPDSSLLRPQVNYNETHSIESHIAEITLDFVSTHLQSKTTHSIEILTLKGKPSFWSDWLHSRTQSLLEECRDTLCTTDPEEGYHQEERSVDNNGVFTMRKLGTNLHMIDYAGKHTSIEASLVETLSLGLNFVPPCTSYPLSKLEECFKKFAHKLKWKYFWESRKCLHGLRAISPESEQLDLLPLRLRSRLCPTMPPSYSRLEKFVTNTMTTLQRLLSTPRKLSVEDSRIISHVRHLKDFFRANNTTLVLKPADKGGATVILHHDFYKSKMLQMLGDSAAFFKVIPLDPVPTLLKHVALSLATLRKMGLLDQRTLQMISPDAKSRCPSLYGLPKIHKPIVSFRPIVSGNGHPTEGISIFIDYLLQPYSISNQYYLKDSTQLLNLTSNMENLFAPSTSGSTQAAESDTVLLFNLDVVGMYTNIPLSEALHSVSRCLDAEPALLTHGSKHFDRKLVTALLRLTLFNNYFKFDNTFYHQTHGIAMGTPCACTVSDIFICEFMRNALCNYPKQPTIYKQYRDDGFGIWTHGATELEALLTHLNSLHATIKFTLNYGRTIDYLDLRLTLDAFNRVRSETYYKDTETFEYLHPRSNHPSHCKQNIALSQKIRHIRNCSTRSAFTHHTLLLKYNLVRRGYKHQLVSRKMRLHPYRDRLRLLKYRRRPPMLRTPLILPYDHRLPNMNILVSTEMFNVGLTTDDIQLIGDRPLIGYSILDPIHKGIVKAGFPTVG